MRPENFYCFLFLHRLGFESVETSIFNNKAIAGQFGHFVIILLAQIRSAYPHPTLFVHE